MSATRATVTDEPAHLPLTVLAGVGAKSAERLAARGIVTLQDLWLHLPRQYEDRTRLTPIRRLQPGVPAQFDGVVEAVERGFRYRPVLRIALGDPDDGFGGAVVLRFFHFRTAQANQFRPGVRLRCYGTPRPGQQGLEVVHPTYRVLADGQLPGLGERLDPVYPQIEGVGAATVRRLVDAALERLPDDAALELLGGDVLAAASMPSLRDSLLTLHRPPQGVDLSALQAGVHPAQRRLVFEELLAHQLSLKRQRMTLQQQAAPAFAEPGALAERLQAGLPFALTPAQQRVLGEIRADLRKPMPMLRLVQGDVGSGKTVVAALAAMQAVEAGMQVALMAPTELLAEQHLANLRAWLQPLEIDVTWLAGKVGGKARRQAMAAIADGAAQVVVGTHALMQEGVQFHSLGLVIVDEQHRFGVHQRLALRDKGRADGRVPHQLIMTATPIPRTLAMSAYADLDVSAIDELPPGRTPVRTVVLSAERRPELIERVRVACADGRQAYWVCTVIDEETEGAGMARKGSAQPAVVAQAAQTTWEQLSAQLPELQVGFVHGRMKPAEKQAAMLAFKRGETDLLVATTVVEVGVDVPNASLMIIENAERLGLSQLHQLRGRVGRGSAESNCVLLYQTPLSRMARQRLDTLRRTNDGFEIAEQDLALRGPGELLGTRQTGLAEFRIADLSRDADLLPLVAGTAERILRESPLTADRLVARWIGSAARYAAA